MKQPNRLAADAPHGFGGGELDRERPLRFRLDGRSIGGYAGDTVLSAVLAAGIDTAGKRGGEEIGLGERFAPAVTPAGGSSDPLQALPMDRTPAIDGLDLVTLGTGRAAGWGRRLRRLLPGAGHSLRQSLDGPTPLRAPWLQVPGETLEETDTIVVGGGLAGMSAALAAAAAGDRVVLLERRPMLGGDARFFGPVGDEETPDAAIARLSAALAGAPNVTVLLRSEVLGAWPTGIRAHQVELRDGRPVGRVVTLAGKRLVLATGTAERLPVFPGNRAPAVSGTVMAFHRADRYGVWLGRRVLFSTTRNTAYRLAMLAKDAGIEVQRIVDTRLNPQSRFIDFCKASGITSASGLVVREALPGKHRRDGLAVGFAVAIEEVEQDTEPLVTEQVIAAGGWQPALALWLMAGGGCRWNAEAAQLQPGEGPASIALAGAVAGWLGHTACQQSGKAAVARLLGRPPVAVTDPQIEAIYETPDGITPVAPQRNSGRGHAYLDGGRSLTLRPPPSREADGLRFLGTERALSVGDVAAAVQTELVPVAQAGVIAAERCLGAVDITDSGWRVVAPAAGSEPAVPSYLAGRFGTKPQLVPVTAADGRSFEPGCLLYDSSDTTDPRLAIGVILRPAPGSGGLALARRLSRQQARRYFVRDSSGPIPVTLGEPLPSPGSG
ncbi:MAG TPA: FAD-dependent oxidoreductase [Devosiaceae bacterium]|jgi:sarcosine oxidase subunit alpha|nr:FAD-dependent oxidoreductase [Devosiaceae bacterium]